MSLYKRISSAISKFHFKLSSGLSTTLKHHRANPRYFYFTIVIAVIFAITESTIYLFKYNNTGLDTQFSDSNELWIRLLIIFSFIILALFISHKLNRNSQNNKTNDHASNIYQAKKQWERVADSLPQLVIAMDFSANVTRVNRTTESWSKQKVNNVIGLKVQDFLTCFNEFFSKDIINHHWNELWHGLRNSNTIERKIKNDTNGETYLFSLKKISEQEPLNDQCHAVLIIDNITTFERNDRNLKKRNHTLNKLVNDQSNTIENISKKLESELCEKNTAYTRLQESQECRLALLREIFTTQENERKRIALELHDSIGQSLSAAKFKIEDIILNLENSTETYTYKQLTNVLDTIKLSIQDTRHIAMDLRPAIIDDLGILPTLKWFCRNFENTYSHIDTCLTLNIDESSIPEKNKIVIFRIIQEAMNNVTKHANATTVTINLEQTSNSTILSIRDNGIGFDSNLICNKDTDSPICHLGLGSINERAESVNGKLNINSSPDRGTTVLITWNNIKSSVEYNQENSDQKKYSY